MSWYYLKRDKGKLEKRFVLSTRRIKASTLKWWGKRRWQIEGWFKTAKHRFGLHRFGQGTLLGMYRWLILSLTAYLIAHWAYLETQLPLSPDWGEAALTARESLFPQIVVSLLLLDIERLIPLARSHGFDIHISRCKICDKFSRNNLTPMSVQPLAYIPFFSLPVLGLFSGYFSASLRF